MDKTSKLFLREQIRRIQDLNGRIDSGRYIIEQVTPELRKALDSIKKVLMEKLGVKGGLVGVSHIKGLEHVDEYVDDVLVNDLLTRKEYCDTGGKVKCVDVLEYFYNQFKDMEVKNFDDVSKRHSYILKNLKSVTPIKLSEILTQELGKPIKVSTFTLTDPQILNFIKDYIDIKDDLIKYNVKPEFDKFIGNIKTSLKNGEYCKILGSATLCTSLGEMENLRDKNIESLEKDLVPAREKAYNERLAEEWISELESKREEVGVAITDQKFDEIKNTLREKLLDGSFCAGCKHKARRQKFYDHMKKFVSERLNRDDIDIEMDKFDKDVYPLIVSNLPDGKKWGKEMRESFYDLLVSGAICSECKTKEEILKKAKEEREEMKYYAAEGEERGVKNLTDFKMRAAKARQIYDDFMEMWGLDGTQFEVDEKSSGQGDHIIKPKRKVRVNITYLNDDDKKTLNNTLSSPAGTFSTLTLDGSFYESPSKSGDVKYWFITKGKYGIVGIGVPVTTVSKDNKIESFFQKDKSGSYRAGKGEPLLKRKTPIRMEVK